MAYDYLGLVNTVCKRLNETELSTSNFASASSQYADIKEAVNNAIRDINQEDFVWPFNFALEETVLSDNDVTLNYPTDAKWVDFNTMRLITPNDTYILHEMDYEEVISRFPDYEENPGNYATISRGVYRRPNRTIGLYPPIETGGAAGYSLKYDYYTMPSDLEAHSDVPTIPERYRFVINQGALMYSYAFRSDEANQAFYGEMFQRGIKNMRKIEGNRFEYMRSGMITRPHPTEILGYRNY